MEKSAAPFHQPQGRQSKVFSRPIFLLTSLLAFLSVYNFVPQARERVQSFFTIEKWEEPVPKISLKQGTFKGKVLDSRNHPVPIEAFLGIPYALPPVGERRFFRPVPVPLGNGTFDATDYSARCPGKHFLKIPGAAQLKSDEDCLTLNVFRWRHSFSTIRKMPVLIYFHSGAFNRGFAAMHDTASMLSWSEEPYLAISFNYRVGALGFLNSELTSKEGLLNLGIHDQKLLLEWVQDNAAAFGGDRNDVTIAGLGAGAHSIGHHIMDVNENRQLFHKAILESGAPTSRVVHTANSRLHKAQFEKFIAEVGCAGKQDSQVLACLRAASSKTIIAAQTAVFDEYNPSFRWAWQPVIDNDIISRRPVDTWKSGNWHKVPTMTGFNHNEGTMYVPKEMAASEDFTRFFSVLLPQLSRGALRRLNELYPDPAKTATSAYFDTRNISELGLGEQYKRVEAAYGHSAYVCPVRQCAHFTSIQEPPVWLYHWAVNTSVIGGANHGDQMQYETMSPLVRNVSPTHDNIAKHFNSYVTSFVVTGDPNKLQGRKAVRRPKWEAFGAGKRTMVFGKGNDEAAGGKSVGEVAALVDDGWASEECRFWWEKS